MSTTRFIDDLRFIQTHPEDVRSRHDFIDNLPAKMGRMDMPASIKAYRLSKAFIPGSEKQREFLEQAADLGNTHAMLDLATQYLGEADWNPAKALTYIDTIRNSGDSFMRHQANTLLQSHHGIQSQQNAKMPKVSGHSMFRKDSQQENHSPTCTVESSHFSR